MLQLLAEAGTRASSAGCGAVLVDCGPVGIQLGVCQHDVHNQHTVDSV